MEGWTWNHLIIITIVTLCKAATSPDFTVWGEENKPDDDLQILFQRKIHSPDEDLTVPELIRKKGYPVELHEVVTKDGYILTLHRIPHGRSGGQGQPGKQESKKRVALLQHGFLCSSADWILNQVDSALAFRLADAGYDVWLGNARGNKYSRHHETLNPNRNLFWNFSFHEMGVKDIPAVLDYILNLTDSGRLYYVGHSMGTSMFWVAMSTFPEYNDKIHAMVALGPVAFVNHMHSPVRLLAPFAEKAEIAFQVFGEREFMPNRRIMHIFRKILCDREPFEEEICSNLIFLICGWDKAQLNMTLLPVILGHTPAGASSRTLIHFAQEVNSGKFRQFDYGKWKNFDVYGQYEPPEYDLSRVTAPVFLFWGPNDLLADPQDVQILASKLPNVKLNWRVQLDRFNHLDFLYAMDINPLVYDHVLEIFESSPAQFQINDNKYFNYETFK